MYVLIICDISILGMSKHLTKILWKYCSNQLITSSANQVCCNSRILYSVKSWQGELGPKFYLPRLHYPYNFSSDSV